MVIRIIEQSFMDEIFAEAFKGVLKPVYLGVFKQGTKSEIVSALEKIDLNGCINISDRDSFDNWFDREVVGLHKRLYIYYKDNVRVQIDNPYSYSARLLNAILKYMLIHSIVFFSDLENFMLLFHPIMSGKFLKGGNDLDIKQVNQIGGKEEYFKLVKQHRDLIDMDLCEENKWMLDLMYGVDF